MGIGGTMQADFFRDQNEREEIARIEQMKRLGSDFIHVVYKGRSMAPRIHGIEEVKATPYTDSETGTQQWRTYLSQGVATFRRDTVTKDLVCDVLDSDYNRFWLSRHVPEHMDIPDTAMRKKVMALKDQPYKVEKTRKEELADQMRKLQFEMNKLDSSEEQPEATPEPEEQPPAPPQEQPKRRPGRPRTKAKQAETG